MVAGDTKISTCCRVPGIKRQLARSILALGHNHLGHGLNNRLSSAAVFGGVTNFFYKPLLPDAYSATLIKKFYFIRLLAARSIRAVLLAKRRPVHGQRRWSNANTAKRCNDFLSKIVKEYESELLGLGHKKRSQWSKMYELRQKAKLKKKKPTKK